MAQERLEEAFGKICIKVRYLQSSISKVRLNCYLDMTGTYWGIAKYSNIAKQNSESVKLRKREKG